MKNLALVDMLYKMRTGSWLVIQSYCYLCMQLLSGEILQLYCMTLFKVTLYNLMKVFRSHAGHL